MSAPQEKPADDPRRGGSFGTLAWLVGSLLVFYALSTGPAMKLAECYNIPSDGFESVYLPLQWVCDKCDPVQKFYLWYMNDLWHISD